MAGKIFYRERRKVGVKEKNPRFRLVAIVDIDMKINVQKKKKNELEQIAKEVGAELVLLKGGEKIRTKKK